MSYRVFHLIPKYFSWKKTGAFERLWDWSSTYTFDKGEYLGINYTTECLLYYELSYVCRKYETMSAIFIKPTWLDASPFALDWDEFTRASASNYENSINKRVNLQRD